MELDQVDDLDVDTPIRQLPKAKRDSTGSFDIIPSKKAKKGIAASVNSKASSTKLFAPQKWCGWSTSTYELKS
jgi:hypothetical protein